MANISPLLQSRINQLPLSHDKMYEDLKLHANDIRPNAPKAHLVEENIVQKVISSAKDNAQDVVNFSKVVRKGEISDNNLGRLNDLGLKFGAGLIAAFLALHSKSRQESIMRFLGGGAFIASMSLWPKIFIYLPARILHGVNPGEKYVSAQGDKKEFWLDNQFLLWDLKGISDEKEQRRQQKTALQCRTLNMATAGVAVPLMTALICNRLEEPVTKTLGAIGLYKAKRHTPNQKALGRYLSGAKPIVVNQNEIDNLIESYRLRQPDKEFFKKMADLLRIDNGLYIHDPDSAKMMKEYNPIGIEGALEQTWRHSAIFSGGKNKIATALNKIEYNSFAAAMGKNQDSFSAKLTSAQIGEIVKELDVETQLLTDKAIRYNFETAGNVLLQEQLELIRNAVGNSKAISDEQIREIIRSLGTDDTMNITKFREFLNNLNIRLTYNDVENALARGLNRYGIGKGSKELTNCLRSIQWDNSEYYQLIKKCNKDYVAITRGRLVRYMKLANPIVGSTADSVNSSAYNTAMKRLFKTFNFGLDKGINGMPSLKELANQDKGASAEALAKYFETLMKGADPGSDKYREVMANLTQTTLSDTAKKTTRRLGLTDSTMKVQQMTGDSKLTTAIFGDGYGSIANLLHNFVRNEEININTTLSRGGIIANFESRLQAGMIKVNEVDIREDARLLAAARRMVYQGNISVIKNQAGLADGAEYMALRDAIYDKEAFRDTPAVVRNYVHALNDYFHGKEILTPAEEYTINCDFAARVKEYAGKLYNDKCWMKKFGTLAIIVAGLTLLIQPFFGNIKREFPNNKSEGGAA